MPEISLIKKVQAFCLSMEMDSMFQDFLEDHTELFQEALDDEEMMSGYNHDFRFMKAYKEYISTFENRIEEFIESEGYTIADFRDECQVCVKGGGDIDEKFFLMAFMSITDYEAFFELMTREIRTKTSSRK